MDGLTRRRLHDTLIEWSYGLPCTENNGITLSLASLAVCRSRCDLDIHHVAGLGFFVDRRPRRLLIAHLFQLLIELFLAYRHRWALDLEPVCSRQLDGRSDFQVKLEGERLPLLEFQIMDVRLCRYLNALLLHELLVSFANQRLQGFLPDCFPELFSDHGRGCFAGSEPGKADR